MSRHTGVRRIHRRGCPRTGRCKCASYEAHVFDAAAGRLIRKTFRSEAAAAAWREDTSRGVRLQTFSASPTATLTEAAEALVAGMKSGAVRTRAGVAYKPSVAAGYDNVLRLHVLPTLGDRRLSAITRNDVQDLVDNLIAQKKAPGTIRNTLMPLRVIYRRALKRGETAVNPTSGLDLPSDRGRRDAFVEPAQAAALITTLDAIDRAPWALMLYAGLRLGEMRAIRWEDVDLDAGELHITRAYCQTSRSVITPKSEASRRTAPSRPSSAGGCSSTAC